jgi:hypothetical protein
VASEERNFGSSAGWNANLDVYDGHIAKQAIAVVNSKVSLDSVFSKYKIRLETNYGSSGWQFKCSCPFPDHRDSKPSFGYNPNIGIFNCFGCHRSGKAVEFISFMEGRSKTDVAKELASHLNIDDMELHNSNFDFENLQELLFNFADAIRLFVETYSGSVNVKEYAKAVSWSLDVYLRENVRLNSIVLEDLEVRILRLKEQLEAYEEPN